MTRFRSYSLHLTVVLPIVLIVLVSMAAVAYSAMQAMRGGVRLASQERAKYRLAFTRNVIEDIEHLMMVEHGLKLGNTLARLSEGPDVEAVRVLAVDGRVLHSSNPAEVGMMMPAHVSPLPGKLPPEHDPSATHIRDLEDLLHADGIVLNRQRCWTCHGHDRAVLGILDVDISLSRQTAGMRTWVEMAGMATILQFGLVALGIIFVLGVVVVRPIRRLERSMAEVRLGNYSAAVEPAGTAELNSLITGFNEMIVRLRHADEVERQAQRTSMARTEQMASMGEWAAGLAHELRNPLSGIKAAVDVLAGEEGEAESRRVLQHVSSELGRVDGVVKQLLNFAKPKPPALRKIDLCGALKDAMMLARPRAGARRVRLDIDCPDRPVEVLADQEMVQQVFLNLVLNAMDAAESGPDPQVTATVEIRESLAWCRVRDNGPGVPASRVATLFRPFTTTKARGTGLGLATSRRLVELQSGELILENPGEAGASFAFSLPIFTDSAPG